MTRSLTGDLTRDLPHSKPSTLGYRGGGKQVVETLYKAGFVLKDIFFLHFLFQ